MVMQQACNASVGRGGCTQHLPCSVSFFQNPKRGGRWGPIMGPPLAAGPLPYLHTTPRAVWSGQALLGMALGA